MKQLSLFPELEIKKKKQAKLGRYERIQRELENETDDFHKIFIDIDEKSAKYNFLDVFSGAGGMSQGLFNAGFEPIVSLEINEIASATYQRNFPNFIPDGDQIVSKTYMTRVEGENTRLRHYLARLHRKTLCYSKSVQMLKYSISLLIHYLKFQDIPIPYRCNERSPYQKIIP